MLIKRDPQLKMLCFPHCSPFPFQMLWERGCHPCFDFAALHPDVIWSQLRCELGSPRTQLSALPPPGADLPSAGGCCAGSRWVLSAPFVSGQQKHFCRSVWCLVVNSGKNVKSWAYVQGEVSLVKFSQLGGICLSAAPELQSTVWFYSWRDWVALSL